MMLEKRLNVAELNWFSVNRETVISVAVSSPAFISGFVWDIPKGLKSAEWLLAINAVRLFLSVPINTEFQLQLCGVFPVKNNRGDQKC